MCTGDILSTFYVRNLAHIKMLTQQTPFIYGQTRLLVIKDGSIWHQTEVWSIKKSFCERLIDCFGCLHLSNTVRVSGLILSHHWEPIDYTHCMIVQLSRKCGNMQRSQSSSAMRIKSVVIIYLPFPLIIREFACFTVKRTFFLPFKCHVERWTKMSPMHVTLKAGVENK